MKRIVCVAMFAVATSALAQSYPTRTVRILVGTSPGSASDLIARAVSDSLAASLGQSVIVENRLGAGGMIATTAVANAEPDGHTINVAASAFTVYSFISNPTWDAQRDFTPVATLASIPNVFVVSPARGWKSAREVVEYAKANPGKVNFASAGIGSSTHMGAEKFRFAAGVDAVHVPYKGSPEAIADVMSGRVDYFFAPLVSALPMIRDGKLAALAVGQSRRASALPEVPTTVEAGYPGSDYNFWIGMLVPAKTPREIIDRLQKEAMAATRHPDVVKRWGELGAEAVGSTPAEQDAILRRQIAQFRPVIQTMKLD